MQALQGRTRMYSRLTVANVVLGSLWFILLFHFRRTSYYDPSSFFYDPERAYEGPHSAAREREAAAYLSKLEGISKQQEKRQGLSGNTTTSTANYCLGIPSVRREKEEFLPQTLASLVGELSWEERLRLQVVVLLSDVNVTSNGAFDQAWLHLMADEVLAHEPPENSPAVTADHEYRMLPPMNETASRDERIRSEYATLVATCQERGADYFILVEDDVVASRDWFSKTRAAVLELDSPQSQDNPELPASDWLYMRLFHSETYLGWNSEEWPTYVRYIFALYFVMMLIMFLHVRRQPRSTGKSLPLFYVGVLVFWVPLYVLLYFMAGRLQVNPYRHGVQEMPQYGCCSQGLVMPERHFDLLQMRLTTPPYDTPADSTIEKLAGEEELSKWAIVPSVFQHVGIRGTSDEGGLKKTTWSFSFERQGQ